MRSGRMRSAAYGAFIVAAGFLMEAATVVAPMFFPVPRIVSSNLVGTAFVAFALGPVPGGLFALGTSVLLHYATGGGGPVGYVLAVRAIEAFAAAYSLASPVGRRKRGWRGKSIGAEPLDPFAAAYSPATPVGYIISGAEPPSPKLRMNGRGVLFPAVRR